MTKENDTKKCYIYTRVSTAMQTDGYSLDAQERKLHDYAEYNNLKIVGKYSDEGKSGKSVAVVGAGPAGLYMAFELYKKGHNVTVYEKRKYAGGLLRYGIPDFKLEKHIIERRIDILKASGIDFQFNTEIGRDISPEYLNKKYDLNELSKKVYTSPNSKPKRLLQTIKFSEEDFK